MAKPPAGCLGRGDIPSAGRSCTLHRSGEITMTGSQQANAVARRDHGRRVARKFLAALAPVATASTILAAGLGAQQSGTAPTTVARPLLPPDLESYIAKGMKLY